MEYAGMNNPFFVEYCRSRGSRCNEIMTMIEHGMTDKRIADKYGTTAKTIAVYRKAMEGSLSVIERETEHEIVTILTERDRRMLRSADEPREPGPKDMLRVTDYELLRALLLNVSGAKTSQGAMKALGMPPGRLAGIKLDKRIRWDVAEDLGLALGIDLYKEGIVDFED